MTNSSIGRVLLEHSGGSDTTEGRESPPVGDEIVHTEEENTAKAGADDNEIPEGNLSQDTDNSDLYSEECATPRVIKRPPPLPPRGKAHAQYPGKNADQSPELPEGRSTPVELEIGGIFRDLMTLSTELTLTQATLVSISVKKAVDYALQAAFEPIIRFTYQDTLVESDMPPPSSRIPRAERFPSPVKDILTECRIKVATITAIVEAAKAASEWEKENELLLFQNWQTLGLLISQWVEFLPDDLDLDMNVLLAKLSLSSPPSQHPLSVADEDDDHVSMASGLRSPSVFSKASFINQARRRKFPPPRRPNGVIQNSTSPAVARIRGGDGPRPNVDDDGRHTADAVPPPAYTNFNYPPNANLARVVRDFLSPGQGQLELRVGEQIQILHGYETEDDWFGRGPRGEGWFPADRVVLLEDPDDKSKKPDDEKHVDPSQWDDEQQNDGQGTRFGGKNGFPMDPEDFVRQTASGSGVNQIFFGQTLTIHVNNGALTSQPPQGPPIAPVPDPIQQQERQQLQHQQLSDDYRSMWTLFSILVGILCISHVTMMILFYLK